MVGQLIFRCSVQFGQLVDREHTPEEFERFIPRRTKQVNRT
jgi:hypothetical protein